VTAYLTARLPEMEREADELERKAQALRQIIAGIKALNGHAASVSEPRFVEQNGTVFVAQALDEDGPRGRDAVLRVMRQYPQRTWKVVDLKRELLRRGWAPTPKAVEATVKRLRLDGVLMSPRYGFYRFAIDPNDASNAERTAEEATRLA
jgi:hypothetical protein